MLTFETLGRRLRDHIEGRIRNGELTARGAARLSGISQPHLHNMLKGVRSLSPRAADRLMRSLSVNVLDLLETEELHEGLARRDQAPEATS